MDKLLLRARLQEILESFEDEAISADVKEELEDSLVAEVTKLDMEAFFDEEVTEEGDDELEP